MDALQSTHTVLHGSLWAGALCLLHPGGPAPAAVRHRGNVVMFTVLWDTWFQEQSCIAEHFDTISMLP